MTASVYQDIRENLRELYLEDTRPWLVGFSGGKDSTMLASKDDLEAHHYCRSAASRN